MIGFFFSGITLPRMKSSISTGTSVTDSSAAAAIAKVFVNASGANIRPSCASSVNTGRNDTVMISRLKKSAGPTSMQAARISGNRGASGGARSRCLCAFSIMTIAASIIAPIAIAMPPRLMILALIPSQRIATKAISTPTRQHQDRDQRAARVHQEYNADQRNDERFLGQRALQCVDRALDQVRAVVDGVRY